MATVHPSQNPEYWANWHASREDARSDRLERKHYRNRRRLTWLERHAEGIAILAAITASSLTAISVFSRLAPTQGVNAAVATSTIIAAVASIGAVFIEEAIIWLIGRHLDKHAFDIQADIDHADQTVAYYQKLGSCIRTEQPRHARG